MEDRQPDTDPPILDYQSPEPWPTAPLYSIFVSLIPHACAIFFAMVQTGLPDLLVHMIAAFAFISSPIFSVLAIRYFLKCRMNWVTISGMVIHTIWAVLFLNVLVGILLSSH